MKKIIMLIVIITLYSCPATRIDVSERKYSTGHMGMPGENVFVFKNENQFYYSERLGYSEGTFVWIDKNKIKLTSKTIGAEIPHKEEKWFKDISNRELTFNKDKLFFEVLYLEELKNSPLSWCDRVARSYKYNTQSPASLGFVV